MSFNRPTLIAAVLAVLIGGVGISQANQPTPPARHVSVHQKHAYKPKPAPAPPAPAAPPAPTPTATAPPRAAAPRPASAVAGRGCVAPTGFEAGVNQVRASHGLPALCTNAALRQAAANRANYLCSNNLFSHDGFYGQVAAVYSAPTGLIGENISAGLYSGDAQVVQEFVNSPHHYENIVRPDYTEQGAASIMCPPPYCTAIGICGAPVPVQINVNNFGG